MLLFKTANDRGAPEMKVHNENIVYWMHLNNGSWALYIAVTSDGLCYVGSPYAPFNELETWIKKHLPTHQMQEDESALKPYAAELTDYLEGRISRFKLPIDLHGTEFQKTVWAALQEVPYGKIVSYTDIAEHIHRPDAVRAVGTAIGANPVLIKVPCHRIIGKNGKLSGYRGGIEMKKLLQSLEKS